MSNAGADQSARKDKTRRVKYLFAGYLKSFCAANRKEG